MLFIFMFLLYFTSPDKLYIILKLFDGKNFGKYIGSHEPVSSKQFLQIFTHIILQCDIKTTMFSFFKWNFLIIWFLEFPNRFSNINLIDTSYFMSLELLNNHIYSLHSNIWTANFFSYEVLAKKHPYLSNNKEE
jgi:hypothetical protein